MSLDKYDTTHPILRGNGYLLPAEFDMNCAFLHPYLSTYRLSEDVPSVRQHFCIPELVSYQNSTLPRLRPPAVSSVYIRKYDVRSTAMWDCGGIILLRSRLAV